MSHLLQFAALAAVLIAIPGPSVLFTISRALTVGRRSAFFTVARNELGLCVQVAAVAFGVGALMERSAEIFVTVKWAGAAYLAYLGVQAIRHRQPLAEALSARITPVRPLRAMRDGLIVGATNPKSIVFFVIALPGFTDRAASHLPVQAQMLIVGGLFPVIALVLDGAWAAVADTVRRWFTRSPRRLELIGGAGGLMMIGLGVSIAATGRKDLCGWRAASPADQALAPEPRRSAQVCHADGVERRCDGLGPPRSTPLHRQGRLGKSMEAVMTVVGRVAALWRYPVKSMAPEGLDGAEISWQGLAGDRRWAFIRDGQTRSGFPWLTIRERPELARYRPRFAEPGRPDASPVLVRTPCGGELDVADPALAAELGPGVRVIKQNRGVFDTMPLSLLTNQSLAGLGRLVGVGLTAGRFRPNVLVEARGRDFPEDAWVGRVLRIGGLQMRVDQRDQRCVMVTVDPVTLRRDPAILRAIARERDNRLGVYGSTVQPGRVAVGDAVELDP